MPIEKLPIIEVETMDIKKLNPAYSEDNEDDNSKYIMYCPNCRNTYKWVEMIKTHYGWWTCPKCGYRTYGG